MASRARAPETAHLRSRLRRGIAKNQPNLPPRTIDSSSEFRDSFDYYWISFPMKEGTSEVPKQQPIVKLAKTDATPAAKAVDGEEGIERLCSILKHISKDFAAKGRPYVSMAANAAIPLVRNDRQDEINPGLWRYIRQLEEAESNRC